MKKLNIENKVSFKSLIAVFTTLLLFFLSYILIQEYTLQTGEEVFLDTRPVDPRDMLRGDYVTLGYDIEDSFPIGNGMNTDHLKNGSAVYLILGKTDEGVGFFTDYSLERPSTGLFIKAKIVENSWSKEKTFELDISKYFVPQGKGYALERIRGDLQVLAVIDKFGTAKIKDLYYKGERIDFLRSDFDYE